LIARGMIADHFDERIGENVRGPGIVPQLTGTPGRIRNAGSATPGQHNSEVYGSLLNLSEDELGTLAEDGVI
jgi:formyl-CoA transferase